MPTLHDIARSNGVEALIDETRKVTPEFDAIGAFPMTGVQVRSEVITSASNSTGSFRNVNEGTAAATVTSETRTFECSTVEPWFQVDAAAADRHERGAQAFIGVRAGVILRQELVGIAKQMYYGVSNNAKGFPGLATMYDATNLGLDATGSTASTGSSVWFLRVAPANNADDDGVRWRFGENGKLSFRPVALQQVLDANDSTKRFFAYLTGLIAYPGIQIQNIQTVGRIYNLTAQTGKGLTDALINTELAKFPAGMGPNLILASQRSGSQLQSSRTATTTTGAPAPFPTTITGLDGTPIPFKITEAIGNTETII